jgi:hypothetical protein
MSPALGAAVDGFDRRLRRLSDADLDRPWAWGVYDGEGIRFGFLRTIEEVATLAVELGARRAATGPPLTAAQQILGRYHVAWRELWAVIDSAGADLVDSPPPSGEWPIRSVLEHVIGSDLGFYVVQRHALDRRRAGLEPAGVSEAEWPVVAGLGEEEFASLLAGPLDTIRDLHARVHGWVLEELAGLGDDDLAANSVFWDGEMPNRFRLHRFESHARQHTIQIEKGVEGIAGPPREVDRLLRLLRRTQAEAEAAGLGAPALLAAIGGPVAESVAARTDDLAGVARVPA